MSNHRGLCGNQAIRRGLMVGAIALALIVVPRQGTAGEPPSKKPVRPVDIPATTEISDVDSGNFVSTIASDGNPVYNDSVDGISSVMTAGVCNGLTWGDWRFDSRGSASRTVSWGFFPDDAILPGDLHYQAPAVPPYTGSQLQHSWMNVQCTCTGKDMYTMTAGSQMTCPMVDAWYDSAGNKWGISPAHSFNGFPETTDVQITCNNSPSGHCVDWFIDPIDAPGVEAVGRVGEVAACRRCVPTASGDYYMRFHIHVSIP